MNAFTNILLVAMVYLSVISTQISAQEKRFELGKKLSKEEVDKCFETTSFTKERLEETRELKQKNPAATPPHEFFCFTKCLGEKRGYISSTGDILVDQIKTNAPAGVDPVKLEEFTKCAGGVGKIAVCEDMSKMFKCMYK